MQSLLKLIRYRRLLCVSDSSQTWGKSNIMAVLKMAAHICKDEGIEVFLPDDLESDAPARVLKIPKTHIVSRPEIFKQIDIAFSFGGDGTIIHLARQIYPYNVPVCGIT